jgi:hypothetical protein
MKFLARILGLLALVLAGFAGIDYFLMDRVMLTRVAHMITPPPPTTREKGMQSAEWLDAFFRAETPNVLMNRGWSLRTFIVGAEDLKLMVEYPADASSQPPAYAEIMELCPIAGVDGYWRQSFAQPYMIYLSGYDNSDGKTLARCDRSFDHARFEVVSGRVVPAPETLILPREGDDSAALKAAAASGEPSFDEVSKMTNGNRLDDLEDALMQRPELVTLYDNFGHTLLYDAYTAEAVRLLVGFGADPNVISDVGGVTPLQWHAESGTSMATLESLVHNGALPGRTKPEFVKDRDIAVYLLDLGAPIAENALLEALAEHRFEIAALLHERGADIGATTSVSPLHYVAERTRMNRRLPGDTRKLIDADIEAFRRALRYGADPQRRSEGATVREFLEAEPDWAGRDDLIAVLSGS